MTENKTPNLAELQQQSNASDAQFQLALERLQSSVPNGIVEILENAYEEGLPLFNENYDKYTAILDNLFIDIINKRDVSTIKWFENACLDIVFPYLHGKETVEYLYVHEMLADMLSRNPVDYEAKFGLALMLLCFKEVEVNEKDSALNLCRGLALNIFSDLMTGNIPHPNPDNWGSNIIDRMVDIFVWLYDIPGCEGYVHREDLVKAHDQLAELLRIDNRLSYKNILPEVRIEFYLRNKEFGKLRNFLNEWDHSMGFYGKNFSLDGYKKIAFQLLDQSVELDETNQKLSDRNEKLKLAEKELEETMAMFAHKFRSPLDAIIYNTSHEHQPRLYVQAAQTMRGLLDIFSIISTDADTLQEKLKQDCQGNANLTLLFSKTLDMILLHLLSVSAAEKIQQHYLRYAKAHGLCAVDLTYKDWNEEHFELERQLQNEWEQSYAQLLSESATLEQRLAWLERHFFKLELQGFERADIQFKEYGITESFLTILLNELLVNAFKYYASAEAQPVILEWRERDGFQVLSCSNPSMRSERDRLKGSGKGHTFLSALARITGSQFSKPKPQDDYIVEIAIVDQLLISS